MSMPESDPLRFEKIIASPEMAELAVLAVPTPPWHTAADHTNESPEASEARTVCELLLRDARTQNVLFDHRLLQIYYFMREREDRAMAFRPDSPFEAASYLTARMPNPGGLLQSIDELHHPKRQDAVDDRNRKYLEKIMIGPIATSDLQQRVDRSRALAAAELDPEIRADANALVVKVLYGKRYAAYVLVENPEL